jgi:hypothetical protein
MTAHSENNPVQALVAAQHVTVRRNTGAGGLDAARTASDFGSLL